MIVSLLELVIRNVIRSSLSRDCTKAGPFLFRDKGSPAEYGAGMKLALERGWLVMHESGTFARFTPAGADLFA